MFVGEGGEETLHWQKCGGRGAALAEVGAERTD